MLNKGMDKHLLAGKKILILGVANERSLAWGIAHAAHAAGAELAFTFTGEALEKRVRPLADSLGIPPHLVMPCDVRVDNEIKAVADTLQKHWGQMDGLVHAIAWAEKEELKGGLTNTTRANFLAAMDISAFSLIALTSNFKYLFSKDASILTLTYDGANRAVPNYNAMGLAKAALESAVRYLADELGGQGVRVNAISAGPVKTLAASGIGDFRSMLAHHAATAPLRRNTTLEDVGGAGVFLLSPLSSGITGEILYVDGGANIIGTKPIVDTGA